MVNKEKIFVVGILRNGDQYLAERRHQREEHFGGHVVFPGGLIEPGETPADALVREMNEELAVRIKEFEYIGQYYYEDGHSSHVYVITKWEGQPTSIEAESIIWVRNADELTSDFDKSIIRKIQHGKQ
jgi:8-oxo-dGTP diphosphatase